MKKKIMLVGYGSAGQYELDFLVRNPSLQKCEFVVSDIRTKEEVEPRLNTTRVSAGLMEYYPKVRYVQMNLQDHDQMVKVLKEEQPDIITYTGRFIPGIKYGHYSYPNQLGYGVWIALAAPLIYNLCKALKDADCKAKVINSSFPDGVVPWLYSAGYTQVITGAGNLNHLIPRFKLVLADKYGVNPTDIDMNVVGAHYLNTYVSKEGNPRGSRYYMRYTINTTYCDSETYELTSEDEDQSLANEIFTKSQLPMETGHIRNLMIASDMANIVDVIVTGNYYKFHLPGVDGNIGGYPAFYNEETGRFCIAGNPGDVREWIEINKQSLRCDGIEDISNGEVTFTEEVIKKMKDIFEIEYPKKLKLEDAEQFAYKIEEAIHAYERKKANEGKN